MTKTRDGAMTAVTPGSAELLEGLIQDAISVLHHDTTDGSDVDKYERECLRKKFSARLTAKPDEERVREATIATCALTARIQCNERGYPSLGEEVQKAVRVLSTTGEPKR